MCAGFTLLWIVLGGVMILAVQNFVELRNIAKESQAIQQKVGAAAEAAAATPVQVADTATKATTVTGTTSNQVTKSRKRMVRGSINL